MASVLDKRGDKLALRPTFLPFSNPQADVLISGPNEQFLRAIHMAFKTDACYIRYGAEIARTYKRFIIFTIRGLTPQSESELINWVSYLRTHQEPKDEAEFHLL